MSSPSPNSEEQAATPGGQTQPQIAHRRSSSEIVYSPEVANMDSPRDGGFNGSNSPVTIPSFVANMQSAVMMKKHIGELYAKLQKAEEDKQKIADEAFRFANKYCS